MNPKAQRSALVWGTIFVALGLAALLHELGVWTVQAAVVLPALLVLAGLALMLTAFTRRPGQAPGTRSHHRSAGAE